MIPPFARNASPPFSRPDVVLRSEDGVDFYTLKSHLSSVSEVFKHLFEGADGEEEELVNGLPIVPCFDPSSILNGLLCYCANIHPLSNSSTLVDIQNLAMKYEMISVAKAIYMDKIKQKRELPPSHILDAIRQVVGRDEVAFFAAASIFSLSEDEANEMVDLGLVKKVQLDSLVQYRDDCRASAVTIAFPPHFHFKWFSERYNWFRSDVEHGNGCNRGGNMFIGDVQGKIMMRYWWREYLYEARRRLEERPWGSIVTSGDFFDKAFKEGSQCDVCRKDDFRQFSELFAREINNAVSQESYHICLEMSITPIL